jgi:hypothetical protein
METTTFEDRVAQITEQIRLSDPSIASDIASSVTSHTAEWKHGMFRASLILHGDDTPQHLTLQLYTGEDEHPAPLQIGFDEADVVNMIAVPVAALLAGQPEG